MKITGIYQIQSVIKPARIYIGSAFNIHRRWKEHIYRLKKNNHDNLKLQNHYNKYGKEDLIFSIIIGCAKEDLISTEQFYIDSKKCWFNLCMKAGSSIGHKWTEEKRKRYIPWNKGKAGVYHLTFYSPSKFKKGHVAWCKGKKFKKSTPKQIQSQETKDKIRKKMMGKQNAKKKEN